MICGWEFDLNFRIDLEKTLNDILDKNLYRNNLFDRNINCHIDWELFTNGLHIIIFNDSIIIVRRQMETWNQ